MPVYEYVCLECRREFERYVRSWNEPVTCPACAKGRVEKQLSTFALAGGGPRGGGPPTGGGCCGGGCGCH